MRSFLPGEWKTKKRDQNQGGPQNKGDLHTHMLVASFRPSTRSVTLFLSTFLGGEASHPVQLILRFRGSF